MVMHDGKLIYKTMQQQYAINCYMCLLQEYFPI